MSSTPEDGAPRIAQGRIHFPDSRAAGWFDYATCLIGLNSIFDPAQEASFDGGVASVPMEQVARVHESAHALQSATFPFFSKWCQHWRRIVLSFAHEMATLSQDYSQIESILQSDTPSRAEIRAKHVRVLEAGGDQDLTPMDLLETHAVLTEIAAFGAADPFSYFRQHAPTPRYHFAFSIARTLLGDDRAIQVLAALITSAFCFWNPVRAFWTLLASPSLSSPDTTTSISLYCQVAIDAGLGSEFIALPSERATSLAEYGRYNPHAREAERILAAVDTGQQSLDGMLSSLAGLETLINSVDPTVFWLPNEGNLAAVSLSESLSGQDELSFDHFNPGHPAWQEYATERSYAALSQAMLKKARGDYPDDLPSRYRWISLSQERPPIFYMDLSGPELTLDGATAAAQNLLDSLPLDRLSDPRVDASYVYRSLGRAEFAFYIDSPLEVWQHPNSRRLIRAIHELCPAFPLVLSPSMLSVWFGSLCPPASHIGSSVNFSDPSVSILLREFTSSVHRIEVLGELDFTILVARLLAPLGRATTR